MQAFMQGPPGRVQQKEPQGCRAWFWAGTCAGLAAMAVLQRLNHVRNVSMQEAQSKMPQKQHQSRNMGRSCTDGHTAPNLNHVCDVSMQGAPRTVQNKQLKGSRARF